jgi:hypothetical protein
MAVTVCATCCPETCAQPDIRFEGEHIRVVLKTASVRVEGTYFFRNPHPTRFKVPLFYPFPIDSLHPWPTDIVVHSQEGDTLEYSRPREGGILFRVDIPALGLATVTVVYEQPTLDGSACYILTTTGEWKRPLARADFEVIVPPAIELESMSYEVERVVDTPDGRAHRFGRENFMPKKDLCVRWTVR